MSSLVVAAAIVSGAPARVLAARRAAPRAHAGRWELPGGKVEPGETAEEALVRELAEELAVGVRIGPRLGPDLRIPAGTLRVWTAVIAAGEPQALDHDLLRWLSADELGSVPWLESDRPLLPFLRELLGRPAGAPRLGCPGDPG